MTLNVPGKITHYNPNKKNSPEVEYFMERAREGFYAVLHDEWIILRDRPTITYAIKNGDHLLIHHLDARTFALVQHFLKVTNGKVLTYWLKQKFETGDLAAIERAYNMSFRR